MQKSSGKETAEGVKSTAWLDQIFKKIGSLVNSGLDDEKEMIHCGEEKVCDILNEFNDWHGIDFTSILTETELARIYFSRMPIKYIERMLSYFDYLIYDEMEDSDKYIFETIKAIYDNDLHLV